MFLGQQWFLVWVFHNPWRYPAIFTDAATPPSTTKGATDSAGWKNCKRQVAKASSVLILMVMLTTN